jgi:hemerythrin
VKSGSELITWSRIFKFGIKAIDDQHKEFIDLVNDMFYHATGNKEQEHEYFNKVIQKVVQYLKTHFETEEKLMRAIHYPGYAEHKKVHDGFILNVHYNIWNFETEKRYNLLSFTKFLKNWVLSHIGVMDKQYNLYFKKMIAPRKTVRRLKIVKARPNRLNITDVLPYSSKWSIFQPW